MLITQNKAFYH